MGLGARLGRVRGLRRQAPLRPRGRVPEPPVPRGQGRVVARPGGTRAAGARRGRTASSRCSRSGPATRSATGPRTVHRVTAIEDTLVIEVSTTAPRRRRAARRPLRPRRHERSVTEPESAREDLRLARVPARGHRLERLRAPAVARVEQGRPRRDGLLAGRRSGPLRPRRCGDGEARRRTACSRSSSSTSTRGTP